MRIAFDIGGVISKHPSLFRQLMRDLIDAGNTVIVLTDMSPCERVEALLALNDIPYDQLVLADHGSYGEMCKDVALREHRIDAVVDDHMGYVIGRGAPVRLLLMPDASLPYYNGEWRTLGDEPSFGRIASPQNT